MQWMTASMKSEGTPALRQALVVVAAAILCVDVLLAGSPNSLSPANSGLTSEKR